VVRILPPQPASQSLTHTELGRARNAAISRRFVHKECHQALLWRSFRIREPRTRLCSGVSHGFLRGALLRAIALSTLSGFAARLLQRGSGRPSFWERPSRELPDPEVALAGRLNARERRELVCSIYSAMGREHQSLTANAIISRFRSPIRSAIISISATVKRWLNQSTSVVRENRTSG
jgi:hypothetical protein